MLNSNLNKIVGGSYKSEEKENTLQNIKMLYGTQEIVIKLCYASFTIASIQMQINCKCWQSLE